MDLVKVSGVVTPTNDLAGDKPDSWKSRIAARGYDVKCVLSGLGEYPGIREVFVRHAEEAE